MNLFFTKHVWLCSKAKGFRHGESSFNYNVDIHCQNTLFDFSPRKSNLLSSGNSKLSKGNRVSFWEDVTPVTKWKKWISNIFELKKKVAVISKTVDLRTHIKTFLLLFGRTICPQYLVSKLFVLKFFSVFRTWLFYY